MKANRFLFGRVAAVLFAALVVFGAVGCAPQVETETVIKYVLPLESDDSIVGTWTSTYDEKFVIATDSFKNGTTSSDDAGYAGGTPYIFKIDNSSGYIYIKYTRVITGYDEKSYAAITSTESTADNMGKWYAIYYSDIATADGKTTAKISGAYKADGKTSTDTLEEAVKEFTVDNGYFSGSSTCTKQ